MSLNYRQVHLDFHTSEKIDGIGERFDKKQFQEALKAGHINSITVFSKCHHGRAYHPSKANEMHPGLKFDLLKAQIEAAHEIGVKTPVYLSAGLDEKAIFEHPEWRFEAKDHKFDNFSKPGFKLLCMNTPYLDYLLAQIKEVVENYDADGIFLDIVGVRMCCCSNCMKSMLEAGLDPNNDEDILKNAERVYANYLKRVRETIDSVKPGLPVFHNGGHIRQGRRDLAMANSHLELESLPTGGWGYDHFPFSASYVQNLGMEYLGMTGKFHLSWGEFGGYKHPNALRYETSLSVAFGAKCSIGDQLLPNGHMDMTTYNLIGAAYKEIEEKEEWLDNVTPITDVAILSVESAMNDLGAVDNGTALTKADIGVGRMMLEGKYMFTVIDTKMDFDKYKVIILPDCVTLKTEVYDRLKEYVKKGGKILASGSSAQENGKLIFDLGAEIIGDSEYKPNYARPLENNEYNTDYVMYEDSKRVKCTGTEHAAMIKPYFNRTKEHFCSHLHAPSSGEYYGSGITEGKDGIYIAWNIFTEYALRGELVYRKMVENVLDKLLSDNKSLETDLGSMGVATLMNQKDKNRLVAHLLYAIPTKRGEKTEIIEDIYPVYNVRLKVKAEPKKVYLAPQREEIPFRTENGKTEVTVKKLDCHQMVVFEL